MKQQVLIPALVALTWACGFGTAAAQANPPVEAQVLRKIYTAERTCRGNLKFLSPYTVRHKEYWKKTPGSFQSFAMLKYMDLMFSGGPFDANSGGPVIFMRFNGGSGIKTCNELDNRIQSQRAPIKPGAACQLTRQLAGCLAQIYTIHRSHVGKKNRDWQTYITSSGVYNPALVYKTK
ncbi:MAG: hypothetical protein AB7F96_19455 [Beijerinckiaceae bacterium]